MLVTVEGIIIGKRTIGENNCFLDILTDEFGVIEATAHGIRKITSKNAGACGLFSYSRFCLAKSGLKYTLNSAEPKYSFHGLSNDIEALSLAAYFAEIIKTTAAPEQEAEGFLRLMAVSLFEIEKRKITLTQAKAVFELRIASMLGFAPDLRACRSCICYEHERMYFNYTSGIIICADCLEQLDDSYSELSPTLLYAMRFIVYSDVNRIYHFNLKSTCLSQLSALSERYLLLHTDRNFKSLDYYNSIKL